MLLLLIAFAGHFSLACGRRLISQNLSPLNCTTEPESDFVFQKSTRFVFDSHPANHPFPSSTGSLSTLLTCNSTATTVDSVLDPEHVKQWLIALNASLYNHNLTHRKSPLPDNDVPLVEKEIVDDWNEEYPALKTPTRHKFPCNVTYEMFWDAANAYAMTTYGSPREKPDVKLYESYCNIVGRRLTVREQAMFLANVVWETAGFMYMKEIACCDGQCQYGKYYGRGFIQLTWEYNYAEASQAIYGDDRLLKYPDMAATVNGGWRTAFYYWVKHVHPRIVENRAIGKLALGYSIQAINGAFECENRGANAYERLKIFNEIIYKWKLTPIKGAGSLEGCRPGKLDMYDRFIEEIPPVTVISTVTETETETTTLIVSTTTVVTTIESVFVTVTEYYPIDPFEGIYSTPSEKAVAIVGVLEETTTITTAAPHPTTALTICTSIPTSLKRRHHGRSKKPASFIRRSK